MEEVLQEFEQPMFYAFLWLCGLILFSCLVLYSIYNVVLYIHFSKKKQMEAWEVVRKYEVCASRHYIPHIEIQKPNTNLKIEIQVNDKYRFLNVGDTHDFWIAYSQKGKPYLVDEDNLSSKVLGIIICGVVVVMIIILGVQNYLEFIKICRMTINRIARLCL
jgi:hypothetical protein